MQFQLITPEREFFSGEAQEISIPGTEGDFGVLAGHAPLISTLRPGVVTIHMADGKQQKVAVLGGVAEATPDRCSVLAEVAKSLDGITREQAQNELETAEKAVRDAIHDDVRERAEQDMLLAQTVLAAIA
jgi:F-type H+-transporting ATPase subunit epsilon